MNPLPRRSDFPAATLRLVALALLGLILSGCTMRALVGMTVEADGSGLFEVSMAFDEELRTLMEQEAEEPIDWSDPQAFEGEDGPADMLGDLPEDASIQPYTEGDFEGFTVSVAFTSLEELNQLLAESAAEGEEPFPFEITQPEEGRFELATHGDVFGETEPTEGEFDMLSESMLEDLFDMRLQVQLPGEIVSTNADETTEEGVMVWRLNPMAEEQVRPSAVSQVATSSVWLMVAVIAALVLAAVAAAVFFLRRSPDPTPDPVEEPV